MTTTLEQTHCACGATFPVMKRQLTLEQTMKTYEITFTGRKLGAIGKFYQITAQLFAENDEAALLALSDRFERAGAPPELKLIESGFASEGLVERVQNERAEFDQIRGLALSLKRFMDAVAERQARGNKEWHDDPDAPEHGLFHAPAEHQFPRAMRDAAIMELVSRHLDVLSENEAANTVNA